MISREVRCCNENDEDQSSRNGIRSVPLLSMVWILRLSMVPILRLRLPLVGTHANSLLACACVYLLSSLSLSLNPTRLDHHLIVIGGN